MENNRSSLRVGNYIMKLPKIGEGSYGTVFLCNEKNTDREYAAKKVDIKPILENERKKTKFLREIKLSKKLRHDNIISLHDVIRTSKHIYLIMEYCDGETLSSFLGNYLRIYKTPPSVRLVQFLTRQIVSGLNFMAENGCIHRDIKLDNIMISFNSHSQHQEEKVNLNDLDILKVDKTIKVSNFYGKSKHYDYYSDISSKEKFENEIMKSTIKIIDLGFARELNENAKAASICGSPLQMAPEIWDARLNSIGEYGGKVDLWSLGCVLYNLYTCSLPFYAEDYIELYNEIKYGHYRFNAGTCIELIDLVNGLIQYNPDARYSWKDVVNHPFIKKNPADLSYSSEVYTLNSKQKLSFDLNDNPMQESMKQVEEDKQGELSVYKGIFDDYIDNLFLNDDCVMVEFSVYLHENSEGWTMISYT